MRDYRITESSSDVQGGRKKHAESFSKYPEMSSRIARCSEFDNAVTIEICAAV